MMHNGRTAAGLRFAAAAQLVGFVVAGGAMALPGLLGRPGFHRWAHPLYPWWVVALAVGGGACAVPALVLPSGRRVPTLAPAVATVGAAQVAGTGVVAYRHWRPAVGMGGVAQPDQLPWLEHLALVVALAAGVAALACLVQLVLTRQLPAPVSTASRVARVVAGLALVALLPVAIAGGDSDAWDATSLGAFALVYALPWGGSVVLTGWLTRQAAFTVLLGCTVGAALAVVGPQMPDLVPPAGRIAFAAAVAALGVATAVAARDGESPSR